MAKPKKPAKTTELEADRQAAYEKNVRETGMSPYNAALVAGFPATQALSMQAEALAKDTFGGRDFKDLAERQGITPNKIIEYLARRAGFFDREDGAKKIVSLVPAFKKMIAAKTKGTNTRDRLADPDDQDLEQAKEAEWDWVEVPDDSIQQKYMAQLLDFLQYTGQAKPGATVPVGNGARSFSIHFHVKEDEQKQLMHAVVLDAKSHMNGNGKFEVIDP